ncbi:hypothetical protein ACKZDW_24380 [Ralstonia syzygii subsp. celebesensis]
MFTIIVAAPLALTECRIACSSSARHQGERCWRYERCGFGQERLFDITGKVADNWGRSTNSGAKVIASSYDLQLAELYRAR